MNASIVARPPSLTGPGESEVGLGAYQLKPGGEKRADADRADRGNLRPYRHAVGHQMTSRACQRAAQSAATVSGIDFDGRLPAGGNAAADQHHSAISTPCADVIAAECPLNPMTPAS